MSRVTGSPNGDRTALRVVADLLEGALQAPNGADVTVIDGRVGEITPMP